MSQTAAPVLDVDPTLPIGARVDDITRALNSHQVVIVAGETGSGKTTQLPKICLLAGRSRIGHTQPRRIAARSVAERIAEELHTELGDLVGYQVRFTRKAGRDTRLKVMTDGVLLAEIGHDRDLRRYDTIIIDEAHERSLNIDFLLGYLKQLLPRRPDLKVIVTSATIDTARFSAHFNDAPIVEVSGRSYPVHIAWRPLIQQGGTTPLEPPAAAPRTGSRSSAHLRGGGEDNGGTTPREPPAAAPRTGSRSSAHGGGGMVRDQIEGICDAVKELRAEGDGDILVFLSGEREIRDTADALAALKLRFTEVVPLYARLSAAEQHRVFTPHTGTRIVLATNVAETSLTVPGIRYVIDPGTARISRYSARTKVQRLPIEPISQASANQRAGRCGRVAPGICIRLYSEEDYEARPEFTEPEILRTNLASVILQMADARLGDIARFPFVEAPDTAQITDGMRLLEELGALNERSSHSHPRLTPVGVKLARIPLDPRLGRMLLAAADLGCLREVQVIVAGLTIQDVRERPAEHRERADALHRRFWAPLAGEDQAKGATKNDAAPPPDSSDLMALMRLWAYLRERRHELSGNALRRLCRDEYLNYLRVREWQDLHTQLRDISKDLGLVRNDIPASPDRIHTALLAGLLSHVGLADVRGDDPTVPARKRRRLGPREYLGARGARFAINPGSALAKNPPPLVMAVELVETTRLWARMVAAIKAEWVEEVGAHLLKRSYSEPHWSARSGSVVALEKVTLYGVPIISDRPVNYGRIDPVTARAIFIQSALVEGQWRTRHHFFERNAEVRRKAEELEERTRRRDIVVDDAAIFAFYDQRVPAGIVSVAHFDRWWRTQRRLDDGFLDLSLDDLIHEDAEPVDAAAFPDLWRVQGFDLPVSYAFDPGSGHDGVTVAIDLLTLNQLSGEPFSWQVPGYRDELATELIRSLPKAIRTRFVPAPNFAAQAIAFLDADHTPDTVAFPDALGEALRRITGHLVDPSAWDLTKIPDYLRVTLVVRDTDGREIARGKNFAALREQLADKVSRTLTAASRTTSQTGQTTWTFGDIPVELEVSGNAGTAVGYPALVDEGGTVGLHVFDSPARQRQAHEAGLRRLVLLNTPDPTRWVVSHLPNTTKLGLSHSPYHSVPDLLADARLASVGQLLAVHAGDAARIRTAAAFIEACGAVRQDNAEAMRRIVNTAADIVQRHGQLLQALARVAAGEARTDITEQVANLVFPGFISATPEPHYSQLSRYLRAALVRAQTLTTTPGRDAAPFATISDVEDAYAVLCAQQPAGRLPAPIEEIGWMIEELRVSLFAQTLGTRTTVSAKRVLKAIDGARGLAA